MTPLQYANAFLNFDVTFKLQSSQTQFYIQMPAKFSPTRL